MMFVIILIGIFFSFALPSFEGLTPKYRLRSAARRLGTRIESHRLLAVTKGVWLGMRYVLEGEDSYYQLIQPPPSDYPSQPVRERPAYAPERLPAGVRIDSVHVRGQPEVFTSGSILILFSPAGTSGSHSVSLSIEEGRRWVVDFNAITGTIDFKKPEEAGFADFEG